MFERRLKIFLGFLALFTLVLLVRAGQVQIVEHEEWAKAAAESMKRSQLIETVRGSILDRNGNALAVDQPCVDICVDYRAIISPPDPKWVIEQAEARLKSHMGEEWDHLPRSKRHALREAEAPNIVSDIQAMWVELTQKAGHTPIQIEEIRQAIVNKVAMRQRLAWYGNYRRAVKQEEDRKEDAGWRRWLVEGISTDKMTPENYVVHVSEESEAHVIIRAADPALQIYLGKRLDRLPGLQLRASVHRAYSKEFAMSVSHLMGHVSRVTAEDVKSAKNEPQDETRQYLPNDEIGRGGIEELCEAGLRGTKGKVEKIPGQQAEVSRVNPTPGQDVRITIDAELQNDIAGAFNQVKMYDAEGYVDVLQALHGAAVVLDVPTGEVLAMVSAPTYDPNLYDEMFARLADDDLNFPLLNRATMAQLQPGSTMKPIVGLGGIKYGVIRPNEGIECTGFMIRPNGKPYTMGRCWVASKFFKQLGGGVAHHPIPVPHPTGFLTFSDALERSCNIFFETTADRLGLDRLSDWDELFGFGRMTGLGIPESRGRLPDSFRGQGNELRQKTWFAGIGQDPVAATPIQMANAAATIARGGIWQRPRLVSEGEATRIGVKLPMLKGAPRANPEQDDNDPNTPPALRTFPDRYDLELSPESKMAVREGMTRVVYGSAGTGTSVIRSVNENLPPGRSRIIRVPELEGITLCGKTGTAQASRFAIKQRDPQTGKVLVDEKGRMMTQLLEPSTPDKPNQIAPWYRGGGNDGKELAHAWYIGFAPAENPKVAFAVMVEYGGSGGGAAAAIARETLIACTKRGYLQSHKMAPRPEAQSHELLRDVAAAR